MKFWICDTNKNKQCEKTSCHVFGGDCKLTTKEEFAIDPENPWMEAHDGFEEEQLDSMGED